MSLFLLCVVNDNDVALTKLSVTCIYIRFAFVDAQPLSLQCCRVLRIKGTKSDGGPACRKNGCANNSAAVARCAGSRTSIRSKNDWRRGETLWAFFKFGGCISRMRRIACSGGSLKKGGSPSTISMTIMPSDQISTSGPYGKRDITSGDIQYGVPTRDLRFGSSCETCAQKPKSESLTRPSAASRMESDLMSRWITPCRENNI